MRSVKARIGVFMLFVLVLFPALVWLFMKPFSLRIDGNFMFFTSIGQLTGLIGMTLFALTLLLSARLHFLESYFGGLDRVYNIHHKTGTIAFLFLAVHPVILAVRYVALSLVDAAAFLLPSADWPKNFGIIALTLVMALLSVTFFAKWRYQILKFLHQILGFAFFFGSLHTFLIPSDVSNNAVLFWYMLTLVVCGLSAYAYRSLFGNSLVSRYVYTVKAVNLLDPTVTEIVMIPEDKRIHYVPGQFIFISFKDGGIEPEVHPFSISSASYEDALRITVKALGDYTKELRGLQVGATASIEGPFGTFNYLHGYNRSQIWIAGGIGITPFLSMARNLKVNTHTGHVIDFYYSTKTKEEMIFLAELEEISRVYPSLRIIPFNGDEKGFLTMDVVGTISGDLHGKDVYVCGPPPMMKSLRMQCAQKGIPDRLVHSEEFKLL